MEKEPGSDLDSGPQRMVEKSGASLWRRRDRVGAVSSETSHQVFKRAEGQEMQAGFKKQLTQFVELCEVPRTGPLAPGKKTGLSLVCFEERDSSRQKLPLITVLTGDSYHREGGLVSF